MQWINYFFFKNTFLWLIIMNKKSGVTQKEFTKSVEKIATRVARKVNAKVEETKMQSFAIVASAIPKNTLYSWNIAYYMSQGIDDHQFLGGKVNLRGIKVNMVLQASINEPVHFDVAIVTADVYAAAVNMVNSDIIDSNKIDAPHLEVDSSKANVVWSKRFSLSPQFTSAVTQKAICEYIKIGKVIEYRDWTVDWNLKKQNYYLVVRAMSTSGTSGSTATASTSGRISVYFKDP